MRIIQADAIISHAANTVKRWGRPNPYGVHTAGGVFEYYREVNRRGNFKTPEGRPVIFDDAELSLILDLARGVQS